MNGNKRRNSHARDVRARASTVRAAAAPPERDRPALVTWMMTHENASTGIALGLIGVLALTSLAVGGQMTRDGEPLSATVSAILWTTPVVLPIAIAAILGGLAVHRYGWIPALGLSAGLWLGPIGQLTGQDTLIEIGIALCGMGIAGFWAAGWIARFPMWIGYGRHPSRIYQRPADEEPWLLPTESELGQQAGEDRTDTDVPS